MQPAFSAGYTDLVSTAASDREILGMSEATQAAISSSTTESEKDVQMGTTLSKGPQSEKTRGLPEINDSSVLNAPSGSQGAVRDSKQSFFPTTTGNESLCD
jgi:hypothetical protein